MATWKKIIVSGSTAVLGGVTLPSLTTNNLVQIGSGGVLQNSGISLASSTASFGAVALVSTSAGSNLSGSFSGSFQGDGSNLTGLVTALDISGSTGADSIDLKTEDLTIASGNSISTAVTANTITVAVTNAGITENQLNTSVAGTGLAGGGGTALSVDLNEVGAATVNVANDSIVFIDADGSNATKKESIADFVSGIAGTNIAAADGQLNLPTTIAGAHTFNNNLTVDGDLTVKGTTTTLQTTNLLVEDKFILLNSGSANPDEGRIIIDEGSAAGHAFVYDADASRFAFTSSLAHNAASVTPDAFVAAVVDLASSHTDVAEYQKNGNIKIDSDGNIFIYS